MPSAYFTEKGLAIRRHLLRQQEQRVKQAGRTAGEEAGIGCDWHDNAGYEDARRRLELESAIMNNLAQETHSATVFPVQEQDERVAIGVTVRLRVGEQEQEFTIGATGESDPLNGLVSYEGPLVRAILGMELGDTRRAAVAGQDVDIEILDLLPPSARYHDLIDALMRRVVGQP